MDRGGALTLSKCFFSILEWEFSTDGLPQQKTQSRVMYIPCPAHEQQEIQKLTQAIRLDGLNPLTQHQLEQLVRHSLKKNPTRVAIEHFCQESEHVVLIPRKLPHQQQIFLGLRMTTNGDTQGAEQHFTHVNGNFGYKIVASRLQPAEFKLAHRAVHLPSQGYKFYGSPFGKKFLTSETHRTTTKLLPKLNLS